MFLKLTILIVLLSTAAAQRGRNRKNKLVNSNKGGTPTKGSTTTSKSGTTPTTQENALNFFYWGDWGLYNYSRNDDEVDGNPFSEARVADQVNIQAGIIKPSFFAVLGDNFYFAGVTSTTDPLWDLYYRNVFTGPNTYVPWYVILGNHDYDSRNPKYQIEYYYEGRDTRWMMPDFQYSKVWPIPGSSKTLEIVFIDTPRLCPEVVASQIGWPANPNNTYPSSNPDPKNAWLINYIYAPVQRQIENIFMKSTADYLMVAGHYEVFTNVDMADQGMPDNVVPECLCLQDRLVPLMEKYGVSVYMNGHQHNFEYELYNGISYITCGHGTTLGDPQNEAYAPYEVYQKLIAGFCNMEVSDSGLRTNFIDYQGNYFYNATLPFPDRSAIIQALQKEGTSAGYRPFS
jgi:hypothetical protein